MAMKIYRGVNGVAREIGKLYRGVENKAKQIAKGYRGVNGVARQFYALGDPISTLAVGDTVKLNVNGTPTEFIIVHIGIPSALYDSSCNGYWLMAKDLHIKDRFSNTNYSDDQFKYHISKVHSYLNGTFLSMLDSDVQSVIKEVKIPYVTDASEPFPVASGANGLSTKIFLPSANEVGTTDSYADGWAIQDGDRWDYFANSSKAKRIAYYTGVATTWWTRTAMKYQHGAALTVQANGDFFDSAGTSSYGYRPTLILPTTALVSEGVVIG